MGGIGGDTCEKSTRLTDMNGKLADITTQLVDLDCKIAGQIDYLIGTVPEEAKTPSPVGVAGGVIGGIEGRIEDIETSLSRLISTLDRLAGANVT